MKKKLLLPVLIICYLFLTGCPLNSDYPLKPLKEAIKPTKYIGTWESVSSSYEGIEKFWLSKDSESNKIIIEILTSNEAYTGKRKYTGWIVTVKDHDFIIIEVDDDGKKSYGHIGVYVKGKKMWLHDLAPNVENDFTSSADLLQYVTDRITNNDLFYDSRDFEKR